jgi:hypothetical protein
VLAIASFGEGNHDEPPRHRSSVRPRQSREHGFRPSSPFGWKSLARIAQPLALSVASQAPSSGSNHSTAGHNARFACETPAATLLIDLIGQGCAYAAWFRSNAAHNPERLKPCQTPEETLQVETPRPGVSTRPETPAHPFTRPAPRRPRQRRLGSSRARLPAARVLRPARPAATDASGQLMHSTFFKDEHPDCARLSTCSRLADEASASRLWPRFRRLT